MFAEELKSMRRLGWRHVLLLSFFAATNDGELTKYDPIVGNISGPTASTQLCIGHGFRPHDLERSRTPDKHRISYRRRFDVRPLHELPVQHWYLIEYLGPCQRIDGTRILSRRLALPHKSSPTTVRHW